MDRTPGRLVGGLACALVLFALAGCSKSTTNATTASDMTAIAGTSLVDQLGGMPGVTNLANSFATNLTNDPSVGKYLNSGAINDVKLGLMNEIARASNMAPPNPGVDLKNALSGKGLDAQGMSAVTSALSSAADAAKLGATQKTALLGLMDPISKGVLGN